MKTLSIVIVSWNVRTLLEQCLLSIYQNLQDVNYEVFVIDNASSDGTVDMLRVDFPRVRTIINKKNVGFGTANNQAFRLCSGEYILLLNPDSTLLGNTVNLMLDCIKQNAKIGVVGPQIVDEKQKVQSYSVRRFPTVFSEAIQLTHLPYYFPQIKSWLNPVLTDSTSSQEVDLLTGACMLLRREAIMGINGFDEQFFLYGEDVDLCLRIRSNGWLIHYLSQAKVVHYAHKSSEKSTLFSPFAVACGSMYKLFIKHRGRLYAASYRMFVFLISLVCIMLFIWSLFRLFKVSRYKLSIYHDYKQLLWALTLKV
jgi:GT2 family glycosyltransferase